MINELIKYSLAFLSLSLALSRSRSLLLFLFYRYIILSLFKEFFLSLSLSFTDLSKFTSSFITDQATGPLA